MISRLVNFWELLKNNLWFTPALFCIAFLSIISGLYYIEIEYLHHLEILSQYVFQGTTDDAKAVVTTLLSAMITMATLAISITIVVLSLAASQLGPRLIKSFMGDPTTKDFIGLFFGSVMACFVLTIALHAQTSETITPQITVTIVFLICLVNLFVLLGFVHHLAKSCIADNVIIRVSKDLRSAIEKIRADNDGYEKPEKHDKKTANWPKDFDTTSTRLYFEKSGYLQHIDYDGIMDLAIEHSLRIAINFKPGHYLVHGEDGLRIYSKTKRPDDLEDKIKSCFIIGTTRTPSQDIEYSIRHLVEIAIRALSPGINDSFTALHVLDSLSASLALLFKKRIPDREFYDENGIKRIHAKKSTEAEIIFSALDQIRFNGGRMPSVIRHLLRKLEILGTLADNDEEKEALSAQAKAIQHDLKLIDQYVPDRKQLNKDIKALLEKLES